MGGVGKWKIGVVVRGLWELHELLRLHQIYTQMGGLIRDGVGVMADAIIETVIKDQWSVKNPDNIIMGRVLAVAEGPTNGRRMAYDGVW